MDTDLFLQQLRGLPLDEGRAYIQEHIEELSDHKAIGELLAEEALRVLYTPFLSLKLAELLIFYGDYTEHLPSHALGLKAKGDALERIDHHQAAMDVLDQAAEEFLSLEDEGNWARSRISWVYAAGWLGRVEDTLRVGEEARNVFLRLNEPYWACIIDNNIAVILEYSGRHEEALNLYENMLAVFPTVTDQGETFVQRSIAITKSNQAMSLLWLGEFERAYLLLQQAQKILSTLGETDLAIIIEVNLADQDYAQGYYGSALRRYYQVREQLMQNDESDALLLAEVKISIANCLVKLYRTQEACLVSEEAVQAYRKKSVSRSIRSILHGYANILVASGRLKEASTVLDEVWNLFKLGGFDPLAYLARLQQAEILLEMDSTAAAYDLACLVKTYFDSRNLVAPSVRASLVIIGALFKTAQEVSPEQEEQIAKLLNEATNLCRQAALQAHQHHLQEEVYKSHFLMGRIFTLQGEVTKSKKQYRIAITQIERMLNDLVHDLSPSFLRSTWAVYEELITLYLRQAQHEQAFAYLERVRSLTLRQYLQKLKRSYNKESARENAPMIVLRTQRELKDWQEKHRDYSVLLADFDASVSTAIDKEIIQAELQKCEAKVNELFERLHLQQLDTRMEGRATHARRRRRADGVLLKAQDVDLDQIRQCLLPEQLLLTYYLYKDKLVIFAITREGMITYENPDGAVQLEHLLTLLPAHLQPGGWPDPVHPPQQAVRRLLHKLYNLLIAPVESHLPSSSGSLTIVPYGPLHTLPFHALYDGTHYLIENFQVNYLPASALLVHLRNVEKDSPSSPMVAAGKPLVFGFSGKGQLQRIQDEAREIAVMLEGNCYLEHEATIARLIEEASGSPIVHLATHGQSRLDAPNFSYVLLADGQLNAIDAFSMDLRECELVTLSGCETGLALSSGADEQLGLGRAFLAAGATSLVMSLWPVEDSSTNELMKRLYEYLLEGESKAQALRIAQCNLLHGEELRNAHPYFWSAFRLVGDAGPLRYQKTLGERLASVTQPQKTSPVIVETLE